MMKKQLFWKVLWIWIMLALATTAVFAVIVALPSRATAASVFPPRQSTLWAPYVEWSINNPSYNGNPFDVIANVTFVHNQSGDTHSTQMFYDGDNTWRFRFTGTRTGQWSFTTSSADSDLHGHTGTVTINSNLDPAIKGFLTSYGNKFAIQTAENQLEGHILNVYMNLAIVDRNVHSYEDQNVLNQVIQEAKENGANSIFVNVANYWFNFGTLEHDQHNSQNPDLRTFRMLENMITTAHAEGLNLHIWAWGDEQRRWTPVGVGGINGVPDKRLQRYIAARFGPLPGWSMGYGFDLHEWVSADQVAEWADYMNEHLGWPHLLTARQESSFKTPANMSVFATDERVASGFYDSAVNLLNNSANRPVIYERRFTYMRDQVWTMENTRRAMWQFAMAGGAAGFWGFYGHSPSPYPNPEQMVTHRQFWQGRFLLTMQPDNSLTNGYALRDVSNACYIFYRENASSIQMNLTNMKGAQTAVAVDTKKPYTEINLGILPVANQTWNAPYQSDWAVAVGFFDNTSHLSALENRALPVQFDNNYQQYLPLIAQVLPSICGN